jgi:hypothetical protein
MSKSTVFTGQPIFTQLLRYIPRPLFSQLVEKHNTDYYVKRFKTYDQLVSMLFAVFQRCTGIRELVTGMQAWFNKLQHLGLNNYPRKSTLSDANQKRTAALFEELFHKLSCRYFSPDSRPLKMEERIYLVDSTTVDLFQDIMSGAGTSKANGKRKGGVKAHMLVSLKHQIPSVVYLTPAKENDRVFMNKITVAPGSILVFDKGYTKYSQWQRWTEKGVYWVTRLSDVGYYQVLEQRPVNGLQRSKGICSDELVLLGSATTPGSETIIARRIIYYDQEKNRTFTFVTNHKKLSAYNIAFLYKQRWSIEVVFKSLKQNFELKYFLGDNANAIQIQIWCALIADLLIKIVKHSTTRRCWSYSNICSMIRMHLATYVDLIEFLNSPEKTMTKYIKKIDNQLKLQLNTS